MALYGLGLLQRTFEEVVLVSDMIGIQVEETTYVLNAFVRHTSINNGLGKTKSSVGNAGSFALFHVTNHRELSGSQLLSFAEGTKRDSQPPCGRLHLRYTKRVHKHDLSCKLPASLAHVHDGHGDRVSSVARKCPTVAST